MLPNVEEGVPQAVCELSDTFSENEVFGPSLEEGITVH